MGRLINVVFLVALAVVQLAGVAALLPLCADQFTAATSCWASSRCLGLQEDCDVPDPDPDKSCSEENKMLDEAATCCADCTATVEAIRQCRGCSSAEDDAANSDTGITDIDQEDAEDDPSTLLKLCSDQLSAVTTCYAANKCAAVPDCDAYDPDVDKTCVEAAGITDEFQSCCSACAGAAQAVRSCRCPEDVPTTNSVDDTSGTSPDRVCMAVTFAFGLTLVHAHLW